MEQAFAAKPASFKLHFGCLSTRELSYDNTFRDDYSPLTLLFTDRVSVVEKSVIRTSGALNSSMKAKHVCLPQMECASQRTPCPRLRTSLTPQCPHWIDADGSPCRNVA